MDDDNYRHNEAVLRQLEPGDLVEFPKGHFSHWGVYVGNGEIVHVHVPDEDLDHAAPLSAQPQPFWAVSGQQYDNAIVLRQHFWDVVGEHKAIKNNKKDGQRRPRDAQEIVRSAISQIGRKGFNLFYSNCEHFATWCRYGKAQSDQVSGVTVGVGVVGAAVCVLWSIGKAVLRLN